ncbi:hypothetical protein RR48_13262 [Papilio machaon]|uniref:Uncharacterized protein n=1 Tax=Papilio machaon TaxID=76193 RepID=A0A194QVR7_PAPMA|nr:hypothetical protein RR48_13262 [Papilio machaon]
MPPELQLLHTSASMQHLQHVQLHQLAAHQALGQLPPALAPLQHPALAQLQHPALSQLQAHPGLAQVQAHPGIPQLQTHPGIPQLQTHPGIPQLQTHSGMPQLQTHHSSLGPTRARPLCHHHAPRHAT